MKQSEWIGLRINPALREALERVAQEQDRTYAWIVRTALAAYFRDHDPDSKTTAST